MRSRLQASNPHVMEDNMAAAGKTCIEVHEKTTGAVRLLLLLLLQLLWRLQVGRSTRVRSVFGVAPSVLVASALCCCCSGSGAYIREVVWARTAACIRQPQQDSCNVQGLVGAYWSSCRALLTPRVIWQPCCCALQAPWGVPNSESQERHGVGCCVVHASCMLLCCGSRTQCAVGP
jgi:hypothetical protein